MLVNWYVDCEIDEQVAETPPPGHDPLSRPTDQKANSPMWLELAQATSWLPSSIWKIRPLKLRPNAGRNRDHGTGYRR